MALESFYLLPSADIHLTPTQDVQLQVIGFDNAASIVNPITGQCTFTVADPGIASVTVGGLLRSASFGIAFMTVVHTASGLSVVARVWCHNDLEGVFLGCKHGSVNVGTDNFQPKIVALFDSMDFEDITGHPYVTYQSMAPALFSVDNVTGRVTGIAPGNGVLRVLNADGSATIGDLPISVKDSLGTDRPFVEQVTLKGTGEDKRNILFLAEGFAAGDENLFRDIVTDLDHKMRTSRLHEPYRLLSDDYNTWMVFEESGESGVSVGSVIVNNGVVPNMIDFPDVQPSTPANLTLYQLIDTVGLPIAQHMVPAFDLAAARTQWAASIPGFVAARLEQNVFDAWKFNTKAFGQMFDKDSLLGFMYGRRLGDRFGSDRTKHADNRWYRELKAQPSFFYKDVRRTGTDHFIDDDTPYFNDAPQLVEHWSDELFDYLASLKRVSAGSPLFDIGVRWAAGGADQALVMVIVNDDVRAANFHSMPGVLGTVSTGVAPGFTDVSTSPDLILDHTPDSSRYLLAPLISNVTHELGHGMFLGDEYEDIRDSGITSPATATDRDLVEVFHNTNTSTQIAARGLKWSLLIRPEQSSALLTEARINAAANTIEVDLFPGEGRTWSNGDSLALMSKNLNTEGAFMLYQQYNSHPVSVAQVTVASVAGDTLTLNIVGNAPGATDKFPKGSMILRPKVDGTQLLNLVLPGVVTWMNNGTGQFPNGIDRVARFLTDKGPTGSRNCGTANRRLVNTPHPIPDVRISRRNRHWLIGAHEGAGEYNCDVVRPAAVCKMRTEYWYGRNGGHFRFCHICRFFIVQEINSSRHGDLDRLYPGTPT